MQATGCSPRTPVSQGEGGVQRGRHSVEHTGAMQYWPPLPCWLLAADCWLLAGRYTKHAARREQAGTDNKYREAQAQQRNAQNTSGHSVPMCGQCATTRNLGMFSPPPFLCPRTCMLASSRPPHIATVRTPVKPGISWRCAGSCAGGVLLLLLLLQLCRTGFRFPLPLPATSRTAETGSSCLANRGRLEGASALQPPVLSTRVHWFSRVRRNDDRTRNTRCIRKRDTKTIGISTRLVVERASSPSLGPVGPVAIPASAKYRAWRSFSQWDFASVPVSLCPCVAVSWLFLSCRANAASVGEEQKKDSPTVPDCRVFFLIGKRWSPSARPLSEVQSRPCPAGAPKTASSAGCKGLRARDGGLWRVALSSPSQAWHWPGRSRTTPRSGHQLAAHHGIWGSAIAFSRSSG